MKMMMLGKALPLMGIKPLQPRLQQVRSLLIDLCYPCEQKPALNRLGPAGNMLIPVGQVE
jgi:hypothetical protein